MKNTVSLSILIISCMIIFSGVALAGWQTQLHVKGQEINGQFKSSVTIGVGQDETQIPAPPKAPLYSSNIVLVSLPAWTPYLVKDIREQGSESNMWVLGINPHGNMPGFEDSSCTVSWDPSKLGHGTFKLVAGIDASGEILISDMKSIASFDVSGWDQQFYFTIVNE